MADMPFSPMAAPPPLREAAPPMSSRMASMQAVQQSGGENSPTAIAKGIGEGILRLIQLAPQQRDRLAEALRIVTEVATESLGSMGQPAAGGSPPGAPGETDGGMPPRPPGMMHTPRG